MLFYFEKMLKLRYISTKHDGWELFMDNGYFSITLGRVWHGVWQSRRIEPNRRLYDFELVWFSSGTGKVFLENEVCECFPGSVILIPPGVLHCTVADSSVERWCIHFDWFGDCRFHADPPDKESFFVYDDQTGNTFVPEYAAKYPDIPGVTFPHCCRSVPGKVYQYIREFFAVYKNDKMSALGFFLLALSGILNAGTQRPRSANVLFRAKSFIDREFSDPSLSAGKVAENCQITVNYLNRLFRVTLGVSTTEYIQTRRLEQAETLLADTGKTIKEISGECGFNDHNYFSRIFRMKKGVTPGRLRRETCIF